MDETERRQGLEARPLTDDEILRMARQDAREYRARILIRLWDAVGKPFEPARLAVYEQELADLPNGLIEQAVSRALREHTWQTVPTVGEVWKAVRAELGNLYDLPAAILEWRERRWRHVLRFSPEWEAAERKPAEPVSAETETGLAAPERK